MKLEKQLMVEQNRRLINSCNDPKQLKEIAISFLELYVKQQETVAQMFRSGETP